MLKRTARAKYKKAYSFADRQLELRQRDYLRDAMARLALKKTSETPDKGASTGRVSGKARRGD